MATRNISLTEKLNRFVDSKIADGEFQNASEVVRAGLRLLSERDEAHAAKIAALRAAAQVGIEELERGEGTEISDVGAWLKDLERETVD